MKKIAIVIGHEASSPGAYSPFLEKTEFDYNTQVASALEDVADIYNRPTEGIGYMGKMAKLSRILNPLAYDLVIELHFNSYDKLANKRGIGTEAVIYPGNEKMKSFGEAFCKEISETYNMVNRGVKEASKGGRGWGFLSLLTANTIILEPFFGDEEESSKFKSTEKYARILKSLICNYK